MGTLANLLALVMGLAIGWWGLCLFLLILGQRLYPQMMRRFPLLLDFVDAFAAFWDIVKPFAKVVLPIVGLVLLLLHLAIYAMADSFMAPFLWELSGVLVPVIGLSIGLYLCVRDLNKARHTEV